MFLFFSFTPQRPCPKSKKVGYSSKKTSPPLEKINVPLPPKRSPTESKGSDKQADIEGSFATSKESLTKPIAPEENEDVTLPVPPVIDSPAKPVVFERNTDVVESLASLMDLQAEPMVPEKTAEEENHSTPSTDHLQEQAATENAMGSVAERQMIKVPASVEVEISSVSSVINKSTSCNIVEGTINKDITEMSTDEEEPNTNMKESRIPDLIPINKEMSTSPAATEDRTLDSESDILFRHPE